MSILEILLSKLENRKIIDSSIPYSEYISIDLSIFNSDLSKITCVNTKEFDTFIAHHLQKNKGKIAYGGYNEQRNLCAKHALFNSNSAEERNIHLGMDLWTQPGTTVLAALDGIVHGLGYNNGNGNYGPTVILKHQLGNLFFYTLYGHLSTESIQNIKIGAIIKQGEKLATLGNSEENGGYSPHLHFQIIKDIQNYSSDYPGVCCKNELEYYLSNCPDPNLLLKIKQILK